MVEPIATCSESPRRPGDVVAAPHFPPVRCLNPLLCRLLWICLSRNVTAHPTADWTRQQLREAFPFAQLPRYLLRDRDAIFGGDFREHVRDMDICEVLSAPRSPWQRAYIERV